MPDDYARELEVALAAVCTAAQVCRSVQSAITPDVLEKQDKSPVTVADFASQAVICRAIGAAFPGDAIIGEENAAPLRTGEQQGFLERIGRELAGVGLPADGRTICDWIDHGRIDRYCERFWTLDPIDGTKGFLRREHYAISLALLIDGRIDLAVLACPNLLPEASAAAAHPHLGIEDIHQRCAGTLLFAVRGQGSCQRPLDRPDTVPMPIAVSRTAQPSDARFCESVESGHSAHDAAAQVAARLGIRCEPIRLDSQAKYAVVARGEADIYLRLPTRREYREKIWDHAGGVLIVEEAGGTVTDVCGRRLDFTHGAALEQNRGVVVSNGRFHGRIIEALAACGVA